VKLLGTHLISGLAVIFYSLIVTAIIVLFVRSLGPIRVDEEAESVGLDLSQHGEIIS
jgi:ammonia channel protein AmtB